MKTALPKFVCPLLYLVAWMLEPSLTYGQVNGDSAITSTVFDQELKITTKAEFAGAITSLTWGGKEFVNSWDHGREFQTTASFFDRFECYNQNEAGWYNDQGSSSSNLISLTASNGTLESHTQMAFYRRDNALDALCGDRQQWKNRTPPITIPLPVLSDYQVHKKVTLGYAGIANVIDYFSELWIPENVTNGQIQSVDANMPFEFTSLWTYDLVSKSYRKIRLPNGEDDMVKVRTTADGNYALGFYSPELLQPYGNGSMGGFRWDTNAHPDPNSASASVGGLNRLLMYNGAEYKNYFNGPGYSSYRSYLVIGSKAQVKAGLDSLHFEFRIFDPDVFDWRDYVAREGLKSALPTQRSAGFHWQEHGINERRDGSRTFSPSAYLQLNTDVAQVYGATNYAGAIHHYIMAGRSEGRSTVAKAACGIYHMIGFTNRKAKAAGYNGYGQLGNGTTTSTSSPTAIPTLDYAITEIAAGSYHSLAVKADGTLWMWGANQWGASGSGSTGGSITTPVQVPVPALISTPSQRGKHAVAAGFDVTAAVDTEGFVWTWGSNYAGKLGNGTPYGAPYYYRYTPDRVRRSSEPNDYLTGIVSVAVGGDTIAAIDSDQTVWTWGRGTNGALGNNSTANSSYPVQVLTVPCKKDGNGNEIVPCQPECKKDSDGNEFVPCQPVEPTALTAVTQVACGSSGFCIALTRYGRVYGWGTNANYQLGTTAISSSTVARRILFLGHPSDDAGADVIAAGVSHCIAHSYDNDKVYAWGSNNYGQLGRGFYSSAEATPTQMNNQLTADRDSDMNRITEVAAGAYFSVMTRYSNRDVFVTGHNQYGQLGLNDQSNRPSPVSSGFSPPPP